MTSFRAPHLARILLVVLYVPLALLASCQPPPAVEPDNIFWPLPPNQPRIKYVRSIFTEDDIGRVYSFREKLFGKDYFDGLVRPYGVSARQGRIYVSDIVQRRVIVFDLASKRLFPVGQEGGVALPASAVADADGNIYVADSGASKVVKYDAEGHYRTSYLLEGGKAVAVAVNDKLARLYVADRAMHRIAVFGLDGTKLFVFGGLGVGDGQFNIPLDVTVDRAGRVYVLDNGNFRVQVFSPDGEFLRRFGSVGDGPGMFANPKGIAVDSEDHVYVTDAAFGNFQIFDGEGNVLLFVGEAGFGPGLFHLPAGIAIDEKDRIYVADQLNGRIQEFQYLHEAAPTAQP
jgi:DNA-binding beta-propeller fold protein YncE